VLYVIEVPPDYHLPADHDDFVATGTEIALAVFVRRREARRGSISAL
jgi:hypothetical protein